jgi:uncharacterized protein (DUF1697 family)
MVNHVSLLRGINVGGNKIVKMESLSKSLEKVGFSNIKTILASGNIIFTFKEVDLKSLSSLISKTIKKDFGFDVAVMVFTSHEFLNLVSKSPFESQNSYNYEYVTFLAEKPKKNLSLIKNAASLSGFEIAKLDDLVVYSLVPKDSKTVDFMKFLDVEFGKNVTTRNWNTIQKIIAELEKRL